VGLLLIGTGVAFAVIELTGRGHRHPPGQEHPHGEEHPHADASHDDAERRSRFHGLAGIAVPFGAAASPDLTILPVFLAATAAGTASAVGSLVVFAVVTIVTIVGLTVAAAAGSYQLRAPWLERWGNAFTAAVLIVLGTLVLAGLI
jgi:cadmium resistance protein CadD (predicted permease)